jgi:FAD/FMN-containing dehydrogenase/ferredoxin
MDTTSAIRNDLKRRVKGDVFFDDTWRAMYSTAACMFEIEPLGVIAPRNERDISRVVKYCRRHFIPITARGAGSSVAGQAIGPGVILDFTRYMNRILRVDRKARTVRIQPGVVLAALNQCLKRDGLTFGPDPSSGAFCTLGGMINTNASGAHSVKYGTVRDVTRRLRVVLDNGEAAILQRGARAKKGTRLGEIVAGATSLLRGFGEVVELEKPLAPKNSSGYQVFDALNRGKLDLHKIFCGSEGTLGILTEALLEVSRVPRGRRLAVLGYAEPEQACEAIEPILNLKPSAIEFMDDTTIDILTDYAPEAKRLFGGQRAYLMVEFDNAPKKLQKLRRTARPASYTAPKGSKAEEIWRIRKLVSPALERRPGVKRSTRVTEDVCVEPRRVGEYLGALKRLLRQHGFEAAIFGHAGSGNIHVNLFADTRDPNDLQRIQSFGLEVYRAVKFLHGTMSGEHGDGLLRAPYMREFFGDLYEVFDAIKQVFDPAGIFNPGKKLGPHGYRFVQDFRPSRRPAYIHTPLAELAPIEEHLLTCIGCAKCHTFCPIYEKEPVEFSSPRAKVNLLLTASQNRIDLAELTANPAFIEQLGACAECRLCLTMCPAGTDLPAIAGSILKGRKEIGGEL